MTEIETVRERETGEDRGPHRCVGSFLPRMVCFSFRCDRTLTKRGKVYLSYTSRAQPTTEGGQARHSNKNLKRKPWRGSACWLGLRLKFSWLSYTAWGHRSRDGATHSGPSAGQFPVTIPQADLIPQWTAPSLVNSGYAKLTGKANLDDQSSPVRVSGIDRTFLHRAESAFSGVGTTVLTKDHPCPHLASAAWSDCRMLYFASYG